MRRIWEILVVGAFVCTLVTLITMQLFLTKGYGRDNKILRLAITKQRWDDIYGAEIYYDGSHKDSGGSKFRSFVKGDKKTTATRIEEPTPADDTVWQTRHSSTKHKATLNENALTDTSWNHDESFHELERGNGDPKIDVEDSVYGTEIQNEYEAIETLVVTEDRDSNSVKELCPEHSPNLVGPLNVSASYETTEEDAIRVSSPLLKDGCFTPISCTSRQKVAVIIPYKDRKQHLLTLLYHLHPILQRQNIMYCIFVAEQFDNGSFNKARVMNAAFTDITANHEIPFDCVIFHDVDMILEDDRNIHLCGDMPKHLSPAIDKFNYTLNYGTKFGGVTAIKVEHYKKVNGHSNNFWGWGGEDNDMEIRISNSKLSIISANASYGRYKMIPHDHPWWFSPLYGVGSYLQSKKHWSVRSVDKSGLHDIHYNVKYRTRHQLWTKITIDIRTILVEEAVVHFSKLETQELVFHSPSYATEDESTEPQRSDRGPVLNEQSCSYQLFKGKTVNKTLGVRERLTYGRMYNTLLEAKEKCNELKTFCGSVVEEHHGRFSLRASAYMHENYLRYRLGMVKQVEVIEKHSTISVHVKICPGDSSYLNFFAEPIVMSGDAKHGPSPAYHVEFKIRIFHNTNTTLMYHSDIMTAHKAIMQEKVDSKILQTGIFDTMGRIYSNRVKLMNLSDSGNVVRSLPPGYNNVSELISKGDGIISIKTPLNGILRHPGCYVCRSTLVDGTGAAILQWKWWFELRAASKDIEEQILDKQLEKAKRTSVDFSETVDKRKKVWMKYHEKLKISQKDKNKKGMPDSVMHMVKNQIPKNSY